MKSLWYSGGAGGGLSFHYAYDPVVGRFISADNAELLGVNGDFASYNLFAYCGNNPVDREDSNGKFLITTAVIKISIGVATQYIADVIGNVLDGQTGWNILNPTSTV